jgi:hypothetical protein
MSHGLPPDPFLVNPLFALEQQAAGVLDEGTTDYYLLFPNLFFDHIAEYAHGHVAAVAEVNPTLADIDVAELVPLFIHGVMMGALSQQVEPGRLESN